MDGKALVGALLLLTVPLAGCAQDGGDGAQAVEVHWVNEPQDRKTGQATSMSWELTGPEGQIQHTGIHWADHSVDDPQTPADYGNTTKAVEPAQVPGTFDADETIDESGTYYFIAHAIVDGEHKWSEEVEVQINESGPVEGPVDVSIQQAPDEAEIGENITVEWQVAGPTGSIQHTGFHWANHSVDDPQTPADYGNSTGIREPADVNGASTFNGTFTEDRAETIYARAHAIHEGSHYWSDEIEIEVTEPGNVTVHGVSMQDAPPSFDPVNVTVEQGDVIEWTNQGSLTHTATNESINLSSGDVGPGETFNWTVPEDLEPGTYEYHCTYHEGVGMVGNFTVEAPG